MLVLTDYLLRKKNTLKSVCPLGPCPVPSQDTGWQAPRCFLCPASCPINSGRSWDLWSQACQPWGKTEPQSTKTQRLQGLAWALARAHDLRRKKGTAG